MGVLSQGEVDHFMATDKTVPGFSMEWASRPSGVRYWRGVVEIQSQQVGAVHLHANPAVERWLSFKVSLKGQEVYRLDVRSSPTRHCNTGCSSDFPRKVRSREHEHVYVEGLGLHCALPLEGLEQASDPEVFAVFCERARLAFEPPYESPLLNEQVPLL